MARDGGSATPRVLIPSHGLVCIFVTVILVTYLFPAFLGTWAGTGSAAAEAPLTMLGTVRAHLTVEGTPDPAKRPLRRVQEVLCLGAFPI